MCKARAWNGKTRVARRGYRKKRGTKIRRRIRNLKAVVDGVMVSFSLFFSRDFPGASSAGNETLGRVRRIYCLRWGSRYDILLASRKPAEDAVAPNLTKYNCLNTCVVSPRPIYRMWQFRWKLFSPRNIKLHPPRELHRIYYLNIYILSNLLHLFVFRNENTMFNIIISYRAVCWKRITWSEVVPH